MTAGTSTVRRNLLIVAGVVAVLLLGLVLKFTFTGSGDDAKPQGGSAQPPAATATDEPATASPAQPTRTDEPVPPQGDKRGCPDGRGGIDSKDPFCKKRSANEAYEHAFADNPAYQCADGRNNGLGADDLSKFRPCINSAFRLEIGSGGSVTLYATTSQRVDVERNVVQGGPEDTNPDMYNSARDWLVRQLVTREPSQVWYLGYFHNPDLEYFATYIRKGGRGDWRLLDSPDEEPLDMGSSYQVVVFWDDPRKPEGDAPLPPYFKWSEVTKPGQ